MMSSRPWLSRWSTIAALNLPLFSAVVAPAKGLAEPSAVERELAEINPDELSPKEALEVLYRLKSRS